MEGLLNSLHNQSCLKTFGFTPRISYTFPVITRIKQLNQKPYSCTLRTDCTHFGARRVRISALDSDDEGEESSVDWESELLGELDPFGYRAPKKRVKEQKLVVVEDTDGMDWCARARKVALKSIEARGMSHAMEDLVTVKKKKKPKKKLVSKKKTDKKIEEKIDDDIDLMQFGYDGVGDLKRTVSLIGDGMYVEQKEKNMEEFVKRLSQFAGPSDHRKEINLNKAIVQAQTADDVLDVTYEVIVAVAKGLSPSPLSPLNIATSLHRIAKNMEKVSMMKTRRLAFARQREMSMLVSIAMTALPECSAQGISNISWALSKIGGELLYFSEMDRIAEVALTKVGELSKHCQCCRCFCFNAAFCSRSFLRIIKKGFRNNSHFPRATMEGTSLFGVFNKEEVSQLEEHMWMGVKASKSLRVIKKRFEENVITIKQLYRVRNRI